MYQVKNFSNSIGYKLQELVEEWIESRKHVGIKFVNMWASEGTHYATIIYSETNYEL